MMIDPPTPKSPPNKPATNPIAAWMSSSISERLGILLEAKRTAASASSAPVFEWETPVYPTPAKWTTRPSFCRMRGLSALSVR